MHATPNPTGSQHIDLPTLAEHGQIDAMAREVAAELGVKLHERPDGSIVYVDPWHHHGVAHMGVVLDYVEPLCCPIARVRDRAVWVAMLTPWKGTAAGTDPFRAGYRATQPTLQK